MAAYVTFGRTHWRARLGVARDSARGSGSLRARCALASGSSSAKALRLASLRAPCALASGSGTMKALRVALAGIALLGIAACSKLGLGGGADDQMSWARAALERNDRIEVVAADQQTSTFTVRVKDTGELRMIRVDQVVAGPPGLGTSLAPATPATPATTQTPATDANAPTATASAAPGNNASSPPADQSTAPTQAASVPRTGFRPDPAPASAVPDPNSDVASVTPGGRTLESGPGYAIKTASKESPASARFDRERSSTTNAAIERRHDPIICQGDRLMQIDNRNLEFDGDAVAAEDGCEIHITNSHISAKGIGISVRAANVHIDNSQIEGDAASIDASDGSQVYASSSQFKGMSRRVDNSSFHDLGGNVWN
jgi:hypothetical protein